MATTPVASVATYSELVVVGGIVTVKRCSSFERQREHDYDVQTLRCLPGILQRGGGRSSMRKEPAVLLLEQLVDVNHEICDLASQEPIKVWIRFCNYQ